MMLAVLLFWVYTASYYTDLTWLGVGTSLPLWHALTYSFVHTSILHLAPNAALHVYYWRFLSKMRLWKVMAAIVPAVLVSGVLARYSEPTIGASAIVFAEIGIVLACYPRKALIRPCLLLAVVFSMTAAFAPHVNTMIHIYALVISYGIYKALAWKCN